MESDIEGAVRSAVLDGMPYAELILRNIYDGVADSIWNPLPRGSHLNLKCDDADCRAGWHPGADAVALRSCGQGSSEHGEIMNERGGIIRLDDDTTLVIGKGK